MFEQGDNSVTDNQGQAAPHPFQQQKIETVKELLDSDRRMTIRAVTIMARYTFCMLFRIIYNELGLRRICSRYIQYKERPGMLQTAILHHDNTPSHRPAHTT